jgi:SAM-dependent methyltransferase
MALETAVFRRLPVRGGGRIVVSRLKRRAARETVLADGPFGIRIEVDPADPVELNVYLWGTYAPEVEAALGRLLVPGSKVIDLGAGTGVMSALMGRLCRPGRVLAVERSGELADRIRRQAALNRAQVEAVTGDPAALDLLVGDRAEWHAVDLIRILVGGTEAAALRGARQLLAAARPALVFDWCPESWSEVGETAASTADLLGELDYALYAPVMRERRRWSVGPAELSGFTRVLLSEFESGSLPGANVVALPVGSAGATLAERLLGVE